MFWLESYNRVGIQGPHIEHITSPRWNHWKLPSSTRISAEQRLYEYFILLNRTFLLISSLCIEFGLNTQLACQCSRFPVSPPASNIINLKWSTQCGHQTTPPKYTRKTPTKLHGQTNDILHHNSGSCFNLNPNMAAQKKDVVTWLETRPPMTNPSGNKATNDQS